MLEEARAKLEEEEARMHPEVQRWALISWRFQARHYPMKVRIAMVAGETSGDLLASHLIAALRQHLPDAEFFGIGGP